MFTCDLTVEKNIRNVRNIVESSFFPTRLLLMLNKHGVIHRQEKQSVVNMGNATLSLKS